MEDRTQKRAPRGAMQAIFASVLAMLGTDADYHPKRMAVAKRRSARRGKVRSDKERAERRAVKHIRAHQLPDICYYPTVGRWARSKGLVIR